MVATNPAFPMRPVAEVITGPKGERLASLRRVDLAQNSLVYITDSAAKPAASGSERTWPVYPCGSAWNSLPGMNALPRALMSFPASASRELSGFAGSRTAPTGAKRTRTARPHLHPQDVGRPGFVLASATGLDVAARIALWRPHGPQLRCRVQVIPRTAGAPLFRIDISTHSRGQVRPEGLPT